MSKFKNSIAFPISVTLNQKIKNTVKLVNDNPDSSKAKNMLIDVITALIKVGLDYFFNHSLKFIKLNLTARKSINIIVNPFKSAILSVTKLAIKKNGRKTINCNCRFY